MSISRAISYILLLSVLAGTASFFFYASDASAESHFDVESRTGSEIEGVAPLTPGSPPKEELSCSLISMDGFECAIAYVANFSLGVAWFFLWAGAGFLNAGMTFTLNLSSYTGGVEQAWKLLRDLINIAFIFGILWMAIQLILGNEKAWKQQLTAIIIAALLINFSLFFTKVIIDASNIVALQFYSQIAGGNVAPVESEWRAIFSSTNSGIADQFLDRLRITSIYSPSGGTPSLMSIALIGIFGTILVLITAAVFFIVGLMLIARGAILLLLMITSPIAFASWMPRLKTYYDMWWEQLTKQALFAPVFFLLIWAVLVITDKSVFGGAVGGSASFATALAGNASAMGIILNFLVIIALVLAALYAARTFSGQAGTNFSKWSQKAMGSIAGGAGGLAGRTLGGNAAKWAANRMSPTSAVGKILRKPLQDAAKASWDIRNFDTGTAVRKVAGVAMGGDNKFSKGLGAFAGSIVGGASTAVDKGLEVAGGPKIDFGTMSGADRAKLAKEKKEGDKEKKAKDNEKSLLNVANATEAGKILDGMNDKEISELPEDILKKPEVMDNLKPGMLIEMAKNIKSGARTDIASHIIAAGAGHPSHAYVTGPGVHIWK